MSKRKQFSEQMPLTPAIFYILLSLAVKERHGYDIMKQVEQDSSGKIKLGPGTLYGAIKRMLEDKLIIEKKLSKAPVPTELYVSADDTKLNASQKDATRIVVKLLDQCGNLLPFIDDIINIEVNGPAKLQGPSAVALKGGAIAFWIETVNEVGEICITVSSQTLGKKNVVIVVGK